MKRSPDIRSRGFPTRHATEARFCAGDSRAQAYIQRGYVRINFVNRRFCGLTYFNRWLSLQHDRRSLDLREGNMGTKSRVENVSIWEMLNFLESHYGFAVSALWNSWLHS